jgi:hypothetical protein
LSHLTLEWATNNALREQDFQKITKRNKGIPVEVCLVNPKKSVSKKRYIQKLQEDISGIQNTLNSEKFKKISPEFPKHFLPIVLRNIAIEVGDVIPRFQFNPKHELIAYNPFEAEVFLLYKDKDKDFNVAEISPIEKNFGLLLPITTFFHEAVHAYGFISDADAFNKRLKQKPSFPNFTTVEEERTINIQNKFNKAKNYQPRTAHKDLLNLKIMLNETNMLDIEQKACRKLSCFDLKKMNYDVNEIKCSEQVKQSSLNKNCETINIGYNLIHIKPLDHSSLNKNCETINIFIPSEASNIPRFNGKIFNDKNTKISHNKLRSSKIDIGIENFNGIATLGLFFGACLSKKPWKTG